MFSLSDKVNNLDLPKGSMSLMKLRPTYGKNESSILSTALNTMHLDIAWFSSLVSLWNHVSADTKGLLYRGCSTAFPYYIGQ
jgi:hypothetical protein